MARAACDCSHHRENGAPTTYGSHAYVLETAPDVEGARYGMGTKWRWRCLCGGNRVGRWQWQADNCSYHAWVAHVIKAEPKLRRLQR